MTTDHFATVLHLLDEARIARIYLYTRLGDWTPHYALFPSTAQDTLRAAPDVGTTVLLYVDGQWTDEGLTHLAEHAQRAEPEEETTV